ncbi:NAD(P)-binding protein [Streptomyces sp. NBC_01443]|uniref:NAD(P)-binding protein n=1 Tax=Streptomyces sp. NBC_01443 TaxID=2903868 RepID=UPI0022591C9A|nr:NAD(P)-binding protein [Streptomyces sp. NBC_01443]MCX4632359.1 FAD-dependent oxidoreductase [Streptomyces sp. NBC_01443]
MTRYDVIVVGAGVAGSLVAHRLGRHGRRVLVLEAGVAGPNAHEPTAGPLSTAAAEVPSSPYRAHPAAAWPEDTDLVGADGTPGFRASGHLRQDGPLPYASGYVRVNGGTGNAWTGLAPRMLPEDFDTESFGYGRRWPLTYDRLEPYYQAAEEELGVAADVDAQREHVGLPFPDDYVFPMRPLPAARLDRLISARLDGLRVKDPVALREVELKVVGTPHARNGVPDPRYDGGRGSTRTTRRWRPSRAASSTTAALMATAAPATPPAPTSWATPAPRRWWTSGSAAGTIRACTRSAAAACLRRPPPTRR